MRTCWSTRLCWINFSLFNPTILLIEMAILLTKLAILLIKTIVLRLRGACHQSFGDPLDNFDGLYCWIKKCNIIFNILTILTNGQ